MNEYRFLKKGTFESISNFENRLNKICKNEKYKAVSVGAGQQYSVIVLLEKIREY